MGVAVGAGFTVAVIGVAAELLGLDGESGTNGEPQTPGSLAGVYVQLNNGSNSVAEASANPTEIASNATSGLPNASGMIGGQGDLCERFPDSCSGEPYAPLPTHEESWLDWGDRLRQSMAGSLSGYWGNVGSIYKGMVWNGPKNLVVGTYDMVVNYDETIANLRALAVQLGEDPSVVVDAFLEDLKEKASSPEGQGELFFDLASAITGSSVALKSSGKFATLMRKLRQADSALPDAPNRLATSSDEAVFWSGIGRGGDKRAAAWVSEHGGATLEATLANRGIKLPRWNPDDPAVVAAWRQASTDFASGATGHIRVLQGDSLRVDAIFRDEFHALIANPNVKSITSINPKTGAEVLLWSR